MDKADGQCEGLFAENLLKYINETRLDFKGMYNDYGEMCLFENAVKLLGPFSSELANFFFVFMLLFVCVCAAWLFFCALITLVFIDKNQKENKID